jgi:hypothetical protein
MSCNVTTRVLKWRSVAAVGAGCSCCVSTASYRLRGSICSVSASSCKANLGIVFPWLPGVGGRLDPCSRLEHGSPHEYEKYLEHYLGGEHWQGQDASGRKLGTRRTLRRWRAGEGRITSVAMCGLRS